MNKYIQNNTYWTSCWWKHNLQGHRNVHGSSHNNMGRVITEKVAIIFLPRNQGWGTAASSDLSSSGNVNWFSWSWFPSASSAVLLASSLISAVWPVPGLFGRTTALDASPEPSWTGAATMTLASSDCAGHSRWTQWKTWKIFWVHFFTLAPKEPSYYTQT